MTPHKNMTTLPNSLQNGSPRIGISVVTALKFISTGMMMTAVYLSGCSTSQRPHAPAPVIDPHTKPANVPFSPAPQVLPANTAREPLSQTPLTPSTPTTMPADPVLAPQADPTMVTQDSALANASTTETPAAAPAETTNSTTTPLYPVGNTIKNDGLMQMRRVVVLLPDRPSLQQVNRDIVQGIRHAHKLTPIHANLEIITIHDDLPADQLTAKVNAFAPDAVIGPLTKADIQGTAQLTATTQIALNRNPEPDHRLQMGLSPEDELTQLLHQRKYKTLPVAVFSSNDPQDKRLLSGLEQLIAKDQAPIITIPFSNAGTEFNTWLKQDGHLDNSQKRITALKQVLKQNVQAEPRLRQDIQVFITLSSAKNTRALIPALRYYQAPWKLLATSKLLPTRKGSDLNEPDLVGMEVTVPPYLLNDGPIQNAFEALGFDAYQLLAYREVSQFSGQTGKLTTQNNQVYRQLEWRHFKKGTLNNWQPNPNAPAPTAPPSPEKAE